MLQKALRRFIGSVKKRFKLFDGLNMAKIKMLCPEYKRLYTNISKAFLKGVVDLMLNNKNHVNWLH